MSGIGQLRTAPRNCGNRNRLLGLIKGKKVEFERKAERHGEVKGVESLMSGV